MGNSVKLLDSGIIYVVKVGTQTEQSMSELMEEVGQLAAKLRSQNKPVLILSNASREGSMDPSAIEMATKVGVDLDYDKSATYGSSAFLHHLRQHLISEARLDAKVANFATRRQAIEWLQS
jgi:hypothetical protein